VKTNIACYSMVNVSEIAQEELITSQPSGIDSNPPYMFNLSFF